MNDEAPIMTLTEAARLLGMSKSNVASFLERYGVTPVEQRARGRRWLAEDVARAKARYEASGRRAADERRRQAMLKRRRESRGEGLA